MEDDAVPVAEAESLLREQEEQKEDDGKQHRTEAEVKGGLLDHIIHNLVSPLSPRSSSSLGGHVSNEKKGGVFGGSDGARSSETDLGFGSDEEMGSVNNGTGAGPGLIKNVISHFFHPSDQQQGEVSEDGEKNEGEKVKIPENEQVKQGDEDEDEGGGGGIIENIVSHLPTSLPDDVTPTTDEASILIHSIIHD